jgi:hypothetical protein
MKVDKRGSSDKISKCPNTVHPGVSVIRTRNHCRDSPLLKLIKPSGQLNILFFSIIKSTQLKASNKLILRGMHNLVFTVFLFSTHKKKEL